MDKLALDGDWPVGGTVADVEPVPISIPVKVIDPAGAASSFEIASLDPADVERLNARRAPLDSTVVKLGAPRFAVGAIS